MNDWFNMFKFLLLIFGSIFLILVWLCIMEDLIDDLRYSFDTIKNKKHKWGLKIEIEGIIITLGTFIPVITIGIITLYFFWKWLGVI